MTSYIGAAYCSCLSVVCKVPKSDLPVQGTLGTHPSLGPGSPSLVSHRDGVDFGCDVLKQHVGSVVILWTERVFTKPEQQYICRGPRSSETRRVWERIGISRVGTFSGRETPCTMKF